MKRFMKINCKIPFFREKPKMKPMTFLSQWKLKVINLQITLFMFQEYLKEVLPDLENLIYTTGKVYKIFFFKFHF